MATREEDDKPAAAVQSVDRALLVLESRGYVEQVSDRGKYRLGFSIARLARASSGHLDLVKLSQDVCDSLAAEVGETTNLAVLDADRIINIAEAIGPAEITLRTWVGQSCPAHATSSGKVLLAGLDAADVRFRLASVLESFTQNTVVKIADLQRELAIVRERGWACVTEELEVGLNAVAAPVHDANAQVIAALSVSGPSYRMGPTQFEEAAK